jgi:signal transduction histidine kinase
LAEQAVAEERNRLARELHDVVAHGMSVITVHAGIGAHLIDTKPSQAAEALTVIEKTGRETLAELKRMLSVMTRSVDDRNDVSPQPGMSELPKLIEKVGEAGVDVRMEVNGEPRSLPTGLDLAVYRVVQEGQTNVVKHSDVREAIVSIEWQGARLSVEVVNPVADTASVEAGQGLRGVGERVTLYDGELEFGVTDGRFRLRTDFPLDDST